MKDKLESDVLKISALKTLTRRDKESRYIPYCDFWAHRGIVRDVEVCEQRRCNHYLPKFQNFLAKRGLTKSQEVNKWKKKFAVVEK